MQFLRWLHGDLRHRICVVSRIERLRGPDDVVFRDHTIRRDEIDWQLSCPDLWLESPDTYVMINETRRQRLASDVVCLKAFVVDLDCHNAGDPQPSEAMHEALARLDAAAVPRPHVCVETGRGVQLIWRLGRVGLKKASRNAQIRWAKTQMALAKICGPLADRSLVDLPRVIRLPGTVNTRASPERRLARCNWVSGAQLDDHNFDAICDAALGTKRREFIARYAQRPAQNDAAHGPDGSERQHQPPAASPRRPRPSRSGGASRFDNLSAIAATRLRDLERIASRHFLTGIPEGYRDTFIMAVATDLAWVTPLKMADRFGDLLIRQLKTLGCVVDERTHGAYLARVNAPLSVTEARRSLGSVVQRFRDAAAGAKTEFAGELRDPRYWYGTERRWSQIGPMVVHDTELLAQLEEILPRHLRRLTRAASTFAATPPSSATAAAAPATRAGKRRDRVAEGRYRRARPSHATRAEILDSIKQGLKVQEAASRAGVTQRTIYNWLATQRDSSSPVETSPPEASALNVAAPGLAAQEHGTPGNAHIDAPALKKRPSSYMALPGELQSQTVFLAEHLRRGGQLADRLAGSSVVHGLERRGGAAAEGGGAGEGAPVPPMREAGRLRPLEPRWVASSPATRAPGPGTPPASSIGAVLQLLANGGRLPRRADGSGSAPGQALDSGRADGVVGPLTNGLSSSGEPSAPGADGLAQLPPVPLNDDDFGPTDPNDG